MRIFLCTLLIVWGVGTLNAQQSALERSLSFEVLTDSIGNVLKKISNEANVQFFYDNSQVDVNRQITLPQSTASIRHYLDYIFKDEDIVYVVRGNRIVLKKKRATTEIRDTGKATISGYVTDQENGENLIGSNVIYIDQLTGTSANLYGFYSITLPVGRVSLNYSFVGYKSSNQSFELKKDTTINIELKTGSELEEVVIKSPKMQPIQETTEMGTFRLSSKQIKSRPNLAGEIDILKVLHLIPGVQSGNEGSAGLYVRGGGPDQNLILLDGVPIYNVSHLFGFLSVFNSDAINSVKLIKGAFPARYGGRLSSVVDISMKEGNMKALRGSAAAGIIGANLTLEGPIKKDKTSFMFSGRRTYLDLLAKPWTNTSSDDGEEAEEKRSSYFFYDLNTKINHKISDHDRIYFSAYTGKDKGFYNMKETFSPPGEGVEEITNDDTNVRWGSAIALLRWNHILNPQVFSNLSLSYSEYNFFAENTFFNQLFSSDTLSDFQSFETTTGIRDWALKLDLDYLPHPNHHIRFGGLSTHHKFKPNVAGRRSSVASDTTFNAASVISNEFAAYVEDDIALSTSLKANVGVHFSGYHVNNKFYHSIQPRLSLRYLVTPHFALKGSYSEMTQYLHLLTNPGVGLPTDLWVPATDRVRPQRAKQGVFGFAYTHPTSGFEASVEGYYKEMKNVIEYKEGASFIRIDENWQDKIEVGNGEGYGVEFFTSRKFDRTEWWIGYTLSWAVRNFSNLNFGRSFPFKFDRRHDIAFAITHRYTENYEFSANWVYGTGTSLTLPVASYLSPIDDREMEVFSGRNFFPTKQALEYEARNSFRMRPRHRLDLNFRFIKSKPWGERAWVISIYNAYNRRNPLFIEQRPRGTAPATRVFREFILFPIIPSVSYQIKF